jgi:hypothetical protein
MKSLTGFKLKQTILRLNNHFMIMQILDIYAGWLVDKNSGDILKFGLSHLGWNLT